MYAATCTQLGADYSDAIASLLVMSSTLLSNGTGIYALVGSKSTAKANQSGDGYGAEFLVLNTSFKFNLSILMIFMIILALGAFQKPVDTRPFVVVISHSRLAV